MSIFPERDPGDDGGAIREAFQEAGRAFRVPRSRRFRHVSAEALVDELRAACAEGVWNGSSGGASGQASDALRVLASAARYLTELTEEHRRLNLLHGDLTRRNEELRRPVESLQERLEAIERRRAIPDGAMETLAVLKKHLLVNVAGAGHAPDL